ncbi:Uncharacterised protein [Chryseobacterium nakagawai]|uniref:Uncharacterized protein n=1 Tax=Chryseobacterium nakagawai TaxID=1241982 RepID=A0AAD0YHQ7_CHRNA|nr:hypothetical protein [Chryseobacterium nakagawai]AZA90911.1 hypothetical protein EG343_09830 [Chryseobacterium nakagawai]VEH22449.1 Uncharacterised protein [Chryseobacterium nakagawai]
MWYNLNAQTLAMRLLPTFLRKERLTALLTLATSEIIDLNNSLVIYRSTSIVKVKHNGQVCKLRKILNDTFDYQRRIRIVDGLLKKPVYIYTDGEHKPKWIGKMFIYTDEETDRTKIDFTVVIPAELKNYKIEIKALVDFYKLASKRYKIIIDENI